MHKQKLTAIVSAALVAVTLGGVATALVGNDFRMEETRVEIETSTGALDGVLVTPPSGRPIEGVVVMVHGDGPVEATQDGLYRPWFEAAADAGFATLSWSKPGVAGSPGSWLEQSMEDRAVEASDVIDWALGQDVPTDRIVLWGASQAGWVLPKIATRRDDIDGVVAVGPAVNWLEQGRFNLMAELDADGADADERARRTAVSDRTRALLERGATYAEYLSGSGDTDPMGADRWGFVLENFRADATADLRAQADAGVPVMLMTAQHDHNVDVADTVSTYEQILGDLVTVSSYDAAHSMATTTAEENTFVGLVIGTFQPRRLLAEGVLADYRTYLRELAG